MLIFSVTCLHDQPFEVQAFRICDLPHKLYLARKRRFRRLQRSSSIHDECEQSEMRIVVCRMFGGGGIDRHRISHERRVKPSIMRDFSEAEFPQLDSDIPKLPQGLHPAQSGRSFAEIVSEKKRVLPNCPQEYLSTTHKGAKQREKRRDAREQKRDHVTSHNTVSSTTSHLNPTTSISKPFPSVGYALMSRET